ncbi:1024_t:CDS:2 [Dentiscutata heterogama]|uniref:1024_t:CDS:1 n=1 Tax=Dentiscutata heterogama TaxID=1316150 RepID=A0ACA9MCI0_9GLOM|nr:1024_t:CDS:2 [Dentiscutata heterogama]
MSEIRNSKLNSRNSFEHSFTKENMSRKKQKLSTHADDEQDQSLITMVKQYILESKISSSNNTPFKDISSTYRIKNDPNQIMKRKFIYSDDEDSSSDEKHGSIFNNVNNVEKDPTTINDDDSTTVGGDDDESTIIANEESIIDSKVSIDSEITIYKNEMIIDKNETIIDKNEPIIYKTETTIDRIETIDKKETTINKTIIDKKKVIIDKNDRNVPVAEELPKDENRRLILEYESEWEKYKITKRESDQEVMTLASSGNYQNNRITEVRLNHSAAFSNI